VQKISTPDRQTDRQMDKKKRQTAQPITELIFKFKRVKKYAIPTRYHHGLEVLRRKNKRALLI
jgi:hypothetical protein